MLFNACLLETLANMCQFIYLHQFPSQHREDVAHRPPCTRTGGCKRAHRSGAMTIIIRMHRSSDATRQRCRVSVEIYLQDNNKRSSEIGPNTFKDDTARFSREGDSLAEKRIEATQGERRRRFLRDPFEQGHAVVKKKQFHDRYPTAVSMAQLLQRTLFGNAI